VQAKAQPKAAKAEPKSPPPEEPEDGFEDAAEKKHDGTVNTKIYARVRGLMPWEPKKVSLAVMSGATIQNRVGHITNEYNFGRVFKPNSSNEEVFKVIVMPLISNVLKGYNAILIAYGQTGSGKTYSMLGKPKLDIVGLLPRMLAYMVDQKSVAKVELAAVEAFGHHVAKIELYDLYDPENQTPIWQEKLGNSSLDMHAARVVAITDVLDAHKKIVYAHAASHFAPTGKNPESSRGHVTFVAAVTQNKGKHETIVSYFVMVDCAGSEGESAFTPDFIARVDRETLIARRLEAGTINTGLSQLQVIFNQLRTKGELTKSIGNGLRRVLHPYINTKTFLSVLFTLSPSVNNAKATESTLKFAVTAGMVKVKPVVEKGRVDFQHLVKELKAHIENQEKVIEENNDTMEDLNRQINRLNIVIDRAKESKGPKKMKIVKRKVKKRIQKADGTFEEVEVEEEIEVPDDSGYDAEAKKLLDGLDDSAYALMKMMEMESDEYKGQGGGHRGRTVTLEENDAAMKVAVQKQKQWTLHLKEKPLKKPPPPPKPQKSKVQILEEKAKEQENDYKRLKSVKVDDLDGKEEISAHAMELQVMYQEQKALCQGLEQSKGIILEYLKDDGRDALIQFFKLRKMI